MGRQMGIFNALVTAVSGLSAQSYALGNISGNIANSSTIGFKRNDTSFADLVASTSQAKAQVSGAVQPLSRATNTVQGTVQSSDVSTNMSVNGDGYFPVQKVYPDGSTELLYTRRGDFTLDKDGYLVNGSGYYLLSQSTNGSNSTKTLDGLSRLQMTGGNLPPKATADITYYANLPSKPKAGAATGLVDTTTITAGTGTAPDTVSGAKSADFAATTTGGGTVTVYDDKSESLPLTFTWAKTAADKWKLFYESDSTVSSTSTSPKWTSAGEVTFDTTTGKMLTPASGKIAITGLKLDGTTIGNVSIDFGTAGLTQYADSTGAISLNALSQDGYSKGNVIGVSVADGGAIMQSGSNGQSQQIGQVVLATFKGQDALQKTEGGSFRQTLDSGPAYVATGTITGSSTEASNTDIASEFSKLIVTQQAYSANTKIVTTANDMLQQVMNMIR